MKHFSEASIIQNRPPHVYSNPERLTMTDDDFLRELLLAEQNGRALASEGNPRPGQTWRIRPGPGRMGRALAAAARWAERHGAKTLIQESEAALRDRTFATLFECCRRLGLSDASTGFDDNPINSLAITGNAPPRIIATINDGGSAWALPLDAPSSRLFVRRSDAGDRVKTCAESREVDRQAIEDYAIPGLCLMENAGAAAVMVAADMLEKTRIPGDVLVIAGGGNNAGDGFVVARGLAALKYRVTVVLLKDPARLTPDAAVNYRLLDAVSGVTVVDASGDSGSMTASLLAGKSLLVDGLLGTGFAGRVSPAFARAIDAMNASGIQTLALDIPSGLSGDSGEADPSTVRAARTVTFANLKPGLLTGKGPEKCGILFLGEIGAPGAVVG